jgi:hypothetical protein
MNMSEAWIGTSPKTEDMPLALIYLLGLIPSWKTLRLT